ncbi:hypothetical protein CORC01_01301 [Colletotrichum orchidophilum]|uniref:Uncharacterized protein n=1 Tax=Colletotrichum orchidophilum TaxID=1209926 RepID=A0A1G4BQ35_9PEZI|nr:uncharacterized protein CORC01_01301 [Colletotrichum orchidophilum]OHF03582.1 hypothetical protein CORC01_01301 [Colletotrichum orchidophilum]
MEKSPASSSGLSFRKLRGDAIVGLDEDPELGHFYFGDALGFDAIQIGISLSLRETEIETGPLRACNPDPASASSIQDLTSSSGLEKAAVDAKNKATREAPQVDDLTLAKLCSREPPQLHQPALAKLCGKSQDSEDCLGIGIEIGTARAVEVYKHAWANVEIILISPLRHNPRRQCRCWNGVFSYVF